MQFSRFFEIPVLKSSTYSEMVIRPDCSARSHATIIAGLKADGFEEHFSAANAALHTAILSNGEEVVTLCRNSVTGELRVMREAAKYNNVAPLKKPEAVSGDEVVLSQIGVGAYGHFEDDPMIGMLYLVKLADGRALLIDGGMPCEECADDIYKALESHGIAKDGDGKYAVAAWVFTHAHGDHIGAFNCFAPKYSDRVSVEYLLYNFPGDGNVASREADFPAFEKKIDDHFPAAKRIVPRAGAVYYFGNATLRVLCSPDLLYTAERRLPYFNNTSITLMLEANGTKTLFMGDGGDAVAAKMLECLAPKMLKSDMVQITHHGLYTNAFITPRTPEELAVMTKEEKAEREAERHIHENLTRLYETAAPSIGLWPMGDTNGQPRNGRTTVMQHWTRQYGQAAYFVDLDAEQVGYDGVNIVRKGDLVTYTASSETELMITSFSLQGGKTSLLCNETWESYLSK